VRREKIDIWVDTKIKPGEQWMVEIDKAMKEARIALFRFWLPILLLSMSFLIFYWQQLTME